MWLAHFKDYQFGLYKVIMKVWATTLKIQFPSDLELELMKLSDINKRSEQKALFTSINL